MPSSSSSPRKPQARTLLTRARILETAKAMAQEQELEELTAEAIAKRAGVAKGTVFAHFGDMDGLLSYLLLDRLKGLNAESTGPARGLDGQPLETVLVHMMALIAVMTENQTMMRVFMENIGVTKGHCAPDFVEQLDRWDATLLDLLKTWQASTVIRPNLRHDLSPEVMLDGVIGFTIHGAILKQSCQVADLDVLKVRLRTHITAYLTP